MKIKTYYVLPLDGYGQPDGNIEETRLNLDEFKKLKENGNYVYTNYAAALYRAQD